MPNYQRHRGKHPADLKLFGPDQCLALTNAVDDYAFLLERGYAEASSLKLVGDRYRLKKRQRMAVDRVACTSQRRERRHATCMSSKSLGPIVTIDGYNQLITIESALAGGIVLKGRDGAFRDLASVHGNYRTVEETLPALILVGNALNGLGVEHATWYLDKPISNSGRLAGLIRDLGEQHGWDWAAEVVFNPDKELAAGPGVVISSDSWVLDNSGRWFNLFACLLDSNLLPCTPVVL